MVAAWPGQYHRPMTIEEHLEQIRTNIDDPAPYLVFADWLQEQGNPWGRLITLQHGLEQRPGDSAIAAEVEALMKKHKWTPKAKPRLLRLEWRWGFIRSIRVFDEYNHEDLDEVLGPVLDLPMAALVQSGLIFRDPRYVDDDRKPAKVLQRFPAGADVRQVGPVAPDDKEVDEKAPWIGVQEKIPASIGRFEQAVVLVCHGISSLPAALGKLPLERIDIDWCGRLRAIPDAVWGIESLGYISMYDCDGLGLNMGQVNNLLFGFVRARTPRKQRIFEAALFRGEAPKATTEQLLFALDNNVKSVRTRALAQLEKQLESPLAAHPVGSGSVVAVLGGLNLDKKALKTRVEATGAKLATKVTAKTTHVVLGEKPRGKQHELGGLPILLERHLADLGGKGKSGKGKRKATASGGKLPLERMAKDLRSKGDKKILAVVQALQEHGDLPAELLPELFLVLQNTQLEKLGKGRKLARKLFAAYAPNKLRNAVARHFKTSMLLAGETKQADRLAALEREAGKLIEMPRLARLMIEDFGCGLKFILARGDEGEIQWALGRRINKRCIDLAGLELSALPDLSAFDLLEVNAANNHLGSFPVALSKLPALSKLDLSDNYLRTLPRSLVQFTALRVLDLSRNRFQTFPKGVVTIAGLKELDLGADTWGETRITRIPKEIVALKKLEVLKIENGHVAVQVPEEMAAMTWLKRFEVTWKGAAKTAPAALRKLLPTCKIC
jgi:uncharacterized protein (TIGR02996 family)